jgi:hypothetical protein
MTRSGRLNMPHVKADMERMGADMSQVRPHMPHVQLGIAQIRPAAILFLADRLCKRSDGIVRVSSPSHANSTLTGQ